MNLLLEETSSQPLYFPSINKNNYEEFSKEYFKNLINIQINYLS